jgi:hypothetical protein
VIHILLNIFWRGICEEYALIKTSSFVKAAIYVTCTTQIAVTRTTPISYYYFELVSFSYSLYIALLVLLVAYDMVSLIHSFVQWLTPHLPRDKVGSIFTLLLSTVFNGFARILSVNIDI